MNTEIFAALRQLEKERGIPVDYMVERITQALVRDNHRQRQAKFRQIPWELIHQQKSPRLICKKNILTEK